ncbi:hypothetical protein FNF29_02622 [Cafeteria roenbergensis]|uniref:EF-hand domain-containing protein n=1 Tax=Cafeteria roenbergensis TaxID=33653 RepID=A0A5A8CMP9_CAFRO|nr:hypothetical protein FNF29_02622 [Cafeteria roenbergensis]|eukprot:KAA0153998.1 hypothetical protein FNF29_02622 [Cafeteria roenbergensis]
MESGLSAANLRRMFRVLDVDNDRLISHAELAGALRAMGLVAEGEDLLVARLVSAMDRNRSGLIKEEEFLSTFRSMTPNGLRQWLNALRAEAASPGPKEANPQARAVRSRPRASSQAVVTITEFGAPFGRGRFARTRQMVPRDAVRWLRKRGAALRNWKASAAEAAGGAECAFVPPGLHRCWVDVRGMDVCLLQELGEVLGYDLETAKDAAVYQRAKAEVLRRLVSDPGVARQAAAEPGAAEGNAAPPPVVSVGAPGSIGSVLTAPADERTHEALRDLRAAASIAPAAELGPAGAGASEAAAAAPWPPAWLTGSPPPAQGDAAAAADTRLHWLLHRIWFARGTKPFRADSQRARGGAPGSEFTLLASRELVRRPPELLFSQLSVVLVDDWTVVTVRAGDEDSAGMPGDSSDEEGDLWTTADGQAGCEGKRRSLQGLGVFAMVARRLHRGGAGGGMQAGAGLGAKLERAGVNVARRPPSLGSNVSIQQQRASASTTILAIELLDAVLDASFEVRDVLKDWQEAIEASLTAPGTVPLPKHTAHIFNLTKTAELYARSLRPLLSGLRSAPVRARCGAAAATSLGDTIDDLATMVSDVETTMSTTMQLRQLYESLSGDTMNRALFLLTITTTSVLPIQLLSGVFGMNFAFMPELGYEYSYLIFWIGALLLCGLIVYWFAKKGFFALYNSGPVDGVHSPSAPDAPQPAAVVSTQL